MRGAQLDLCYQFMPLMSESLREVMHRSDVGTLEKLSRSAGWDLVEDNVLYHILTAVLQGLQHLESLNMQHCDIKGMPT